MSIEPCHDSGNKTCRVAFRHGAGDTANFALQLELYRRRGWDIEVQCNPDKAILLEAAGARVDTAGKDAPGVAWNHAPGQKAGEMPPLWVLNKSGFNLGRGPMPHLDEDPAALWREYVEVQVEPQLPADVWRETDDFLRGLPKPVVLLHTIGNSCQNAKSLGKDVTLDLYRGLLDGMDGSLVLLDWDNRVPRLASHRVRHLTDDWKRIDLARLLALLHRSSLFVGIDSGPTHCSRMTGTPALAVFPKADHAPHMYMLPRPGLAMITPRVKAGHPGRHYRHSLQIIEEQADAVSGSFIARQALRMLDGPRYLSAGQMGADVQLQHLIQERERGGGNFLTDYVDRHRGFDVLLRELRSRAPRAKVIETGCTRQEEDWSGAGMGTLLLGAFLSHTGGSLVSVDINPAACALARRLTHDMPAVSVVEGDSVKYLTERTEPADLIYCDSLDADLPETAGHGLNEAKAAARLLGAKGLIAFDDTVYRAREFHGKGRTAVPWLIEQGWRIVWSGYQTILSRT